MQSAKRLGLFVSQEHVFAHLCNRCIVHEAGGDGEGEGENGGGTFRRDDIAVYFKEVAGIGGFMEMVLETGIARGTMAFQNAVQAKNHWGSTDGGDEAVVHSVEKECFVEWFARQECFGSRHSAGEDKAFALFEFTAIDDGIGHRGDAVGTNHRALARNGNGLNSETAAAQNVHRGERLNFFETVG